MTPLERAARALHKRYIEERIRNGVKPSDLPAWDDLGEDGSYYFTASARAVIVAIREPDTAVIEAGGEQVLDTEVGDGQYASIADGRGSKLMANNQAVNAWAAMIDAILAGGE